MTDPTKFTNVDSEEGYMVDGTEVLTKQADNVSKLSGDDSTTSELHDKVNEIIDALESTKIIASE